MITSAADYKWLSVSGLSGFISGDILPKRDIDANGSWRVLKYEDYLFLLEAFYERANWSALPTSTVAPAGRALSGSAINGAAIKSTTAWTGDFVDRSVALPTGIISTNSAATIASACGLGAPSWLTPFSSSPANTRQLKAENIRKCFWNVKLATRTLTAVTTNDIATSWMGQDMLTNSRGETSVADPQPAWGVLWNHGNASRVGSHYIAITITYKSELQNAPWASSATLLVKTYTVQSTTLANFYDIFPVSCQIVNGVVQVPSLSGIAPAACSAHGLTYTTGPSYKAQGGTDGGFVDIAAMALVIDHAFPAEINSLQWNWTP